MTTCWATTPRVEQSRLVTPPPLPSSPAPAPDPEAEWWWTLAVDEWRAHGHLHGRSVARLHSRFASEPECRVAFEVAALELCTLSPQHVWCVLEPLLDLDATIVWCAAQLLVGASTSPALLGGVSAFVELATLLAPVPDLTTRLMAWDVYVDRMHVMPVSLLGHALALAASC